MFIDQIISHLAGQIYYDADEGGSGGNDGDEGGDKPKKIQANVLPDDVLESLKGLVNRAGGESEAIKILYADNKNLRDRLRVAEDRLPEGRVAVEKSEAELLAKLKEREIQSIKDLDSHFETVESAQSELQEAKMKVKIATAQEVYGVNAKVLQKLLKTDDLDIELEEGKAEDGTATQVVKVVSDNKKTDLKEFATENWSDFESSLFDGKGGDQNTGRRFVKQSANSGSKKSTTASEFLEQRDKRIATGNALKGKPNET